MKQKQLKLLLAVEMHLRRIFVKFPSYVHQGYV